ncbi:Hypothetical predicted protein, partial [Podarcis lilfordi]
ALMCRPQSSAPGPSEVAHGWVQRCKIVGEEDCLHDTFLFSKDYRRQGRAPPRLKLLPLQLCRLESKLLTVVWTAASQEQSAKNNHIPR